MFSNATCRINNFFFALWTLLVILTACQDNRRTSNRSRRVDNQLIDSVERKKTPQTIEKSRVRETKRSNQNSRSRLFLERPSAVPQKKASEQSEDTTEKERNLEEELRSLIGNPIECLSPKAGDQAPDTIELALQAYVTSNGVVSRSSVQSPYLSNIELSCVQRRIDNGRFKAPIYDAPRAVRTTVTLRQVKSMSPKTR